MGLSNAERQERYRQRLKARASGADLAEQAREAIDAGFSAYWQWMERNRDAVGGFEDCTSLDAFKRAQVGRPEETLQMLEDWKGWDAMPRTDSERDAMEKAAGVMRAALLRHVAMPTKPKRRGR